MIIATDPAYLEGVANHSEVFPRVSVRGQQRIDLALIWSRCVACQFEGGGYVFLPHGEGLWEVHVLFLRHSKGVHAAGVEAIGHLFDNLGADRIAAHLPDDVPAARRLALRLGFEFHSHTDPFPRHSGDVLARLYVLTKERFHHVTR